MFSYFWKSDEPTHYVPLNYVAAYDPIQKRAILFSGVAGKEWRVFGGYKVTAVLDDGRVLVHVSGRDQTGVGRTVIGIVTPGEERGRVLVYLRREDTWRPQVGPDGTIWVYDQDLQRFREAKMGGKVRTLPSGTYFHRYYMKGNFEVDRKTGARIEVLQRNDLAQHWGDHLIVTRDKEFFLWDRPAKKLVSLGPAMPVMGKDYTEKRIVFRTDTRKGVVRRHKMLIIDR